MIIKNNFHFSLYTYYLIMKYFNCIFFSGENVFKFLKLLMKERDVTNLQRGRNQSFQKKFDLFNCIISVINIFYILRNFSFMFRFQIIVKEIQGNVFTGLYMIWVGETKTFFFLSLSFYIIMLCQLTIRKGVTFVFLYFI